MIEVKKKGKKKKGSAGKKKGKNKKGEKSEGPSRAESPEETEIKGNLLKKPKKNMIEATVTLC